MTPHEPIKAACRICGTALRYTFVDLGMSPLCENYLRQDELNQMEAFYPLHVFVCEQCFLVQLQEYVRPEAIFTEYAYFSSYSETWLEHARQYTGQVVERFGLDAKSRSSNWRATTATCCAFRRAGDSGPGHRAGSERRGGGDPQRRADAVAFFGCELAEQLVAEGGRADLIAANNVLAQVPDLNDFVAGIQLLLEPDG